MHSSVAGLSGQPEQIPDFTRVIHPHPESVPAPSAPYSFLTQSPFVGRWVVDTESTCILWTGTVSNKGYGQVYFGGRTHTAHRLAYILAIGPIADPRLFACHHCDVRLCLSPPHLFLGSHSDNMADMWAKGRHPGPRSLVARGITAPTIPLGRSYPMRCYERAVALANDPTLAAHGLHSTYRRFLCRCVQCREANRLHTRDYAAKRKAAAA
jgi:hypothetical protein